MFLRKFGQRLKRLKSCSRSTENRVLGRVPANKPKPMNLIDCVEICKRTLLAKQAPVSQSFGQSAGQVPLRYHSVTYSVTSQAVKQQLIIRSSTSESIQLVTWSGTNKSFHQSGRKQVTQPISQPVSQSGNQPATRPVTRQISQTFITSQ